MRTPKYVVEMRSLRNLSRVRACVHILRACVCSPAYVRVQYCLRACAHDHTCTHGVRACVVMRMCECSIACVCDIRAPLWYTYIALLLHSFVDNCYWALPMSLSATTVNLICILLIFIILTVAIFF